MTVIELEGRWVVCVSPEARAYIAGPFDTMAEAWRWIDRIDRAPVSRAEATSEFVWGKFIHGE